MEKTYRKYTASTLKASVSFWSNIFGSEAYSSEPKRFATNDVKQSVLNIRVLFVDHLVAEHGLEKKEIRPFLDAASQWARRFGKATVEYVEFVPAGIPGQRIEGVSE